MKLRQILVVGIPLIIIGGGVFFKNFFAAKKTEAPKAAIFYKEKIVETLEIKYTKANTLVNAFGRINSAQNIMVTAEVAGKIIAGNISLKASQKFEKGDLLYKIDDTEARLALISQKNDFINSLGAALADIKIDFSESFAEWDEYLQKVDVNKPLPEIPAFKNKKEKVFFSNRRISTSFYTIKSAEERLNRYSFRAPYQGSIAELKVELNSVVNPGAQLMRIIRTDEMEAEVAVKSTDIKWVKNGMEVLLYSETRDMKWKGKITRVGDFIDPNTQSIPVYVTITPSKENKLYEGMYVMAEIQSADINEIFELPRKAIFGNSKVYTIVDGKLKKEEVNIVKFNAETAYINGLKEGAIVVAESMPNASENLSVKIKE
jgi:membrane fusion protein, multidrug efflux system